jgi:hypothetical protein
MNTRATWARITEPRKSDKHMKESLSRSTALQVLLADTVIMKSWIPLGNWNHEIILSIHC